MDRCRVAFGERKTLQLSSQRFRSLNSRFRLSHGARRPTVLSFRPLNYCQFRSRLLGFRRVCVTSPSSPSSAASLRSGGLRGAIIAMSFSSSLLFTKSSAFNSVKSTSRRVVAMSTVEIPSVCRSSLTTEEETSSETFLREEGGGSGSGGDNGEGGGGGGGGGDAVGWISSAIVFALWGGLIIYSFLWAPNQTPSRDMYFVEKLLFLRNDDGFEMNRVLVAEWFSIAYLTFLYSCLLIPTGRSTKDGVKVGPFAVVAYAVGSFALLPYFGLWRPPPPSLSKDELSRFPLNILESKITAVATIIAGIVLAAYAGFPGDDWQWAEFVQYTRESKFIHVMSIDFVILLALFPFWVYNDLTVRQGSDKFSWLVPVSVVPFFGVPLHLLLRPPIPPSCIVEGSSTKDS